MRQSYFHDFFNYAGLHRSVWLYSTPPARVDDVTVVTGLSTATTGSVDYRVEAAATPADTDVQRGAARCRRAARWRRATGAQGVLTVPDVHPVAPGDGYLYDLEVAAGRRPTAVVDRYAAGRRHPHRRGPRHRVPHQRRAVLLHRLRQARGPPVRGKGHDDVLLVHDFELMDWIGANSFRTSHYPYAEEVSTTPTAHGIVVIDETAAVGQNMRHGRGHLRRPRLHRPSRRRRSTTSAARCTPRPSASSSRGTGTTPASCCGASPNEPESRHRRRSRTYFEPLFALTRELDPTRPVGFVNVMLAPHGQGPGRASSPTS